MTQSRGKQPFSILALVQALTAVWLCIVGVVTTVGMASSGVINYQMSEWMISYSAGFLRRGLSGEIAFRFAAWTGLGGLTAIKLIGFATLAAFLVLFVRRVIGVPGLDQSEKFTLLFMPTGLSFILVNTSVVLRKEYLAFLVFFGFLALLERAGPMRRGQIFLYMAGAGSITILIHELFFFFFMPYCGLLLWARAASGKSDLRRALSLTIALLAVPAAVALVAIIAPPPSGAGDQLCAHAQSFVPALPCQPMPKAFMFAEAGEGGALAATYRELISTRIFGMPAVLLWGAAYLFFTWVHFEILWRLVRGQIGAAREADARAVAFLLCALNTFLVAGMAIITFDLGRWFFILATLATATAASTVAAESLADLAGRLGLSRRLLSLPLMPPRAYRRRLAFAGLISLLFRFRHCCAYRPVDFLWFIRDILIYYKLIPEEVEPVLASLARVCDC